MPHTGTLKDLLRGALSQVDVDAEGASVSGTVGPAAIRVAKRKRTPWSGEVTVPAGQGTVMVGRGENGQFKAGMTQRVKGVDVEAEYDDRGPRMRVSKTLNVRWK